MNRRSNTKTRQPTSWQTVLSLLLMALLLSVAGCASSPQYIQADPKVSDSLPESGSGQPVTLTVGTDIAFESVVERLVELGHACFPGMPPWKREHIESQLAVFPEGQLVVEYEGKLVAASSSLIVDFGDYEDWHDWMSIAGDGYINATEAALGLTLTGVVEAGSITSR